MIVVVVGSTGMIGYHLCQKLSNEGHKIYAIVRSNSKKADRIKKIKNLIIVECELSNIKNLPSMINEKCDVIYHLAWDGTFGSDRNMLYSQVENIKYSIDVVNAAQELGCKVFIGAGSQAEFGRYEGLLNDKVPCNPENGYGIAKLCAGYMTRIECEKYGIKHIWTRILSIYGPFDNPKTLVSTAISSFASNMELNMTLGEQTWDYLYVKDCANALYLLGLNGKHGKTYCIGSGIGKPLKEYINIINEKFNIRGIINYGSIPYSNKQVMYLIADISDLKNDVGFYPEYSFEEGIDETLNFYKRGDKI